MGCGQGAAKKEGLWTYPEVQHHTQHTSNPRKLAEDHWSYNEKLIQHFDLSQMTQDQLVNLLGFFYVEAMVHGWKHAKES